MNVTTIEQSKHLLELGLKPESADLFYSIYSDPICGFSGYEVLDFVSNWKTVWGDRLTTDIFDENNIPAWSLDALLKLIPNNPKFKCAFREYHENKIIWTFWCHAVCEHEFEGASDLECIYKMICWLLENKYIKP